MNNEYKHSRLVYPFPNTETNQNRGVAIQNNSAIEFTKAIVV